MTKTITLEIDAYEKLRAAKVGRESFSAVVRRAILPKAPRTGKDLIEALRARAAGFDEAALAEIEMADRNDAPPGNPWEEAEK